MKRLSFVLVVFSVSILMTNSALAVDFNQVTPDGGLYKWSEPNNWMGTIPDGTAEVKIRKSDDGVGDIATLDSSEVWAYQITNRMRVYEGATLNIVAGGTLNGPGWLRVGASNAGTINQTGGLLELRKGNDNSRLVLGDSGGGVGNYNISAGTLTYLKGESGDGHLTLGDRGGSGTLAITSSSPTIDMRSLRVGGRDSGRAATGTLEFNLSAGAVSPVQVEVAILDPAGAGSTAALVVNLLSGSDPTSPILLVESSLATPVSGRFDTLNGGSGAEGATVVLGSTTYMLHYHWDSVSGVKWAGNDIALIPEPATLLLLGLGSLVAIRRKK